MYSDINNVERLVFNDFTSLLAFKTGSREFQAIGKVTLGKREREVLHIGTEYKLFLMFLVNLIFPSRIR